jgi:hypothetical protein
MTSSFYLIIYGSPLTTAFYSDTTCECFPVSALLGKPLYNFLKRESKSSPILLASFGIDLVCDFI